MNETVNDVVQEMEKLPQHLQWQVLEFARMLANTQVRGVPGQELLEFAGCIPADDVQMMRDAIEQDCGQIVHNKNGAFRQVEQESSKV